MQAGDPTYLDCTLSAFMGPGVVAKQIEKKFPMPLTDFKDLLVDSSDSVRLEIQKQNKIVDELMQASEVEYI